MAPEVIFIILCFFISDTSSVTEQTPDMVSTDRIVEQPLPEGKPRNGTTTYTLSDALLIILMRTSLLYVYFVMTLYYVVLMEADDVFSRLMAVVGKFMVVITIGTYMIAEYFLPTRDMYHVISRVAVILFMLSILHLAVCIFRTFVFWRIIVEIISYYWRRAIMCAIGPPGNGRILQAPTV